MLAHLQSLLGIGAIIALAWIFSEERHAFSAKMVVGTLVMEACIALLLLKVRLAQAALYRLNAIVNALTQATHSGTSFIFGYVGGGPTPFAVTDAANLVNFAFGVLPLVIVIAALSAILWYWRILPAIVHLMARFLHHGFGLGGAVGLSAASMVFLGNIEGQLVIRPYLSKLARSELFILMTVGLSVIAGTVFVLYATILKNVLPAALGHLLIASFMSLPGGVLIARIMVPGRAITELSREAECAAYHSTIEAMTRGTEDGLKIYLQIIAMLIVTTSLVALSNMVLALLPQVLGAPLTLERLLGWVFAPLVWLLGVPRGEAVTAGGLMGIKIVLNELLAYLQMAKLAKDALDPRATMIMVYAMCGFANFASVGILIGGMSALIPQRRLEIVSLAPKALVAGALASSLSGALIGFLPI